MIYHQYFFNRRDWLIENYHLLKITEKQLLVLLIIDAANQKNISITNEYLEEYTRLTSDRLNQIISQLITMKFLEITPKRNKILFSIDGVFHHLFAKEVDDSLLNNFQKEFGRLLSHSEIERLNELVQKYTTKQIEYGLREAIIHKKYSLDYVERVILNAAK